MTALNALCTTEVSEVTHITGWLQADPTDYSTFVCYCPDDFKVNAEGNYDASGAYCGYDYTADCDYDDYWEEWTCYTADWCYASDNYFYLTGDTDYCLDDCPYGYDEDQCDYDTDTGYYYCSCREAAEEESEWDMFTETPYECKDPFWCALTPPGSDPDTWTEFEGLGDRWRHGYFDTEGEAYASCVDAEELVANYL
jgi:hypothetical protein